MNQKRNKKHFRLVIDTYVYFARQVSSNPHYNFICNDKEAIMIDNFLSVMYSEVGSEQAFGENYLVDYLEFQFNRHLSKPVVRSNRSSHLASLNTHPYMAQVIGKPALKEWDNRKRNKFIYAVRYGLKSKVKIKAKKNNNSWREILLNINPSEEFMKEKFHNTTKGLLFCYVSTNLYNHKSPLCSTCLKKDECKETLRLEHGNVFKLRGYE